MNRSAQPTVPRTRRPELEHDSVRWPGLGYESPADSGLVRCISHGWPTPLARWHVHEEHELHLITATSGEAYVGDWIGRFEPGHLVLCGPRLPHNWISTEVPEGGVAERDRVIQFAHGPLAHAAERITEFDEVLALLERARHGVEFFGYGARAAAHFDTIRAARGFARLSAFLQLLGELAAWPDWRTLSGTALRSEHDDSANERVHGLIERITRDHAQPLSAQELAAELGLSESGFSRFFRQATGSTFRDFVNRVRVQRACQLLSDTEALVSHIGVEVGFHNLANFNRRFLELKGVTPTAFRRQARRRYGRGG